MLKKIRNHLKLVAIAAVLILVLVIVSSLRSGVGKNGSKTQQIYTVSRKNIKSTLSLSGTVDAEEATTLQFQTSGKLNWVGVKEGDSVQKYQAIANLDQRSLQKSLEKELYDFLDARWDYDQLLDDYETRATSQKNTYLTDEITRIVQKSQFGLDKTVLDVELAQLSVELATLISPIEGIVTHIDSPYAGVNITPATARFEIVNPNTLFLKVVVDQQDVVKLKEGMSADIIFDSFPNNSYRGRIYYLSFKPAEGEESSYLVKFSLPANLATKLRLGMAAEVNLTTAQKHRVLAVPYLSIIQEGARAYVTVQKGPNQLDKRRVVTGIESDEYVEIKQGLKPGEIVVY